MKQTEPDHQATPEEGMKYDDVCQRVHFASFPNRLSRTFVDTEVWLKYTPRYSTRISKEIAGMCLLPCVHGAPLPVSHSIGHQWFVESEAVVFPDTGARLARDCANVKRRGGCEFDHNR